MGRLPVIAFWLLTSTAACSLNTAGEWPGDGGPDFREADGVGPDVEADGPDARDDAESADEADGIVGDEAGEGDGDGEIIPGCGNGVLEAGELCDSDDLGGAECSDLGFALGTLGCTAECLYDTSGCVESCVDGCPALDDLRCLATTLQVCVVGEDGCLAWSTERDCGAESMICEPLPGAEHCLGGAGDSCDTARVADSLPLNISGGDITTSFHGYHDFTGSRCDTASGVEAVFVRWMTAGESVRIRETGNVDVVLRVLSECSDSAPCLASRNEPESPGLTFTAPAAGNYYFVVEAVHAAPPSRGYNITVEESPGGETCSDPLWAEPLPVNLRGGDIRTVYTDDVRFSGPGCSPADGVEVILARAMRAGETVRLRETGNLDSVLRVLSTCAPTAACLASRDEPESPGLSFTAPSEGVYHFVVESKLALPSSVGYDITLEDAPDGDLCTDPFTADPLPFNVRGGDIRTIATNDVRFTGAGCSPAEGVDLFFRRDMAAGETARIRDTGTADLVLRVVSSCDATAPCLADRDTPENPGLTFTAPSSGAYWFVAEALLAAPATVGYDITVDDPPPGELCTDPLASAIGTTLSGGDFTAAFTDDINFTGLGCSYAGGAEVVLAVTMATGESLRINELGSLDVVIRVMTSCAPAASCLHDVDLPENPGPLFVAPFAGTFYIVVESVLTFPTARAYDIRLVAP